MTRLPERLPAPLSERLSSASSAMYSRQGREFDIAIGGIPFRLATFSELPQAIETIPVRKDQQDTEVDPGEQSLTGWWRRSQSSWHEGAGNLYQESSDSNVAGNGFFDSSGMDVFTPGQITLLRRMTEADNTTGMKRVRVSIRDTTGTAWISTATDVGDLAYRTTKTSGLTVEHAPASNTIVDGLIAAGFSYSISTEGNFYEKILGGAVTTWPLNNTAAGAPTRIMFGKHRPWIIGGRNLWQPDLSDAGGTAQTPVFTHPNRGWVYTCMAEGPTAMYFGGHDGNSSTIQAITLDSGGGLPTLTGASTTAVLPDGELIQELSSLAGQFIGIGTSRGFRVGTIGSTGIITYGPLIIEPAGVTACTAIASQNRFFLVAFDADVKNVYRVDTSTQLSEGVYPYARDADFGDRLVTSLADYKGDVIGTDTTNEFWYQHDTEYVSTGYVQSGRIRYRTTEPKEFRFLHLEIQPLAGVIACDLIKEGGSTFPLGSVTIQGDIFDDKFSIDLERMKYASVKLTVTPTGDLLQTPIINSYLLRSLPAAAPQRLITLPLLCFDQEQARSGQRYGGQGYAKDRLQAMQILEDAAETLVYQDFAEIQAEGRLVVIESMRFTQTAPPTPVRAEGAGGILLLQLRTVDA